MTKTISVAARKEAEEHAWRAEAERRYAERQAAGLEDNAPGAGTPARAHEIQAIDDWRAAWAEGDKAPRGAKALAERRRKSAAAEIAKMPKGCKNSASPQEVGQPIQHANPGSAQMPADTSIPTVTKKRGRPTLNGAAMTVAERSRKRREAQENDLRAALAFLTNLAFFYAVEQPRKCAFKIAAAGEAKWAPIRRVLKAHGLERDLGWFEDMESGHIREAIDHVRQVHEERKRAAIS
jgi:hypothetical protein